MRIDSKGREYVGQANSIARYKKRQQEHADLHPRERFTFEILERVPKGSSRCLDVAKEDWIQAGPGPKRGGGRLQNDKHQMSDKNYLAAGGTIS